jgi:hypothetical protein
VQSRRAGLLACCPPALLLAALSAGCGGGGHDSPPAVDSAVSIEVALTRFREGLAPPRRLTGGVPSLAALGDSFAVRLERGDTAGLATLTLTRAEFAYLYYPSIPESRPPYELPPELFWFNLSGHSARGLSALMSERGGHSLGYAGLRCDGEPRRFQENTVWPLCLVMRVQAPGDTVAERLFGPVVERGGRYKLVSLANRL